MCPLVETVAAAGNGESSAGDGHSKGEEYQRESRLNFAAILKIASCLSSGKISGG
jgi:hypothetical protein